jgi:MEMO1 family protein
MDCPKLRYGLEAFPVEHEGQKMVVLRDRSGFCEGSLLLSPPVADLLVHMDGKNTFRDLQLRFMRRTGEVLFSEKLQEIVQMLDDHYMLENEKFIRKAGEEAARFLRDPVRRAKYAGKSYPAEPEALVEELKSYFDAARTEFERAASSANEQRLVALVAPHIDIQAGGPCFASAYKAVGEAIHPTTWVVLGTAHEPLDNYFALTTKDFETPLGLVRHDPEICEELLRLAPRDLRAGEYSHHREHTIEFQCVFLAYSQPQAKIVPLLCSFSLEDWEENMDYLDEVAAIIRQVFTAEGRSVGLIASVDLAHIGPRYGDNFRPGQAVLSHHLTADVELLKTLENCDSQAFIRHLQRDRNARRVCGLAPLYMLARILDGSAHGRLLLHEHAVVDQHHSFVTFASMAFYQTG